MPAPGSPRGRRTQLGLFLILISVVLVLSSVTWFSSGRAVVGVAQLAVGGVLACAVIVWLRLARASDIAGRRSRQQTPEQFPSQDGGPA